MHLSSVQELAFLAACLEAAGVREDVAAVSAEQMVEADLRGYGSHGMLRLTMIVNAVESGVANGDPHPRLERERPTGGLLDGDRGPGGYVGREAMRIAITKARATGVGMVGIRDAHYSGLMAYFADMASREGLVAFLTSSTPPMVHIWGGRAPVLGTTPLCISVPGDPHPFTLDMATSAAARGKVMTASLQGESIPASWALDVDGKPTTDAQRALEGVLSPFGGHKGSGLGFMMSLFTGPLLGVAREVEGPSTAFPTGARHKGDFFWVFDPELFGPLDPFIESVTAFADHVRSSPRVEGVDAIRLPGERAYAMREVRLQSGIDVDDAVWERVCEVANRLGVSTAIGDSL